MNVVVFLFPSKRYGGKFRLLKTTFYCLTCNICLTISVRWIFLLENHRSLYYSGNRKASNLKICIRIKGLCPGPLSDLH